MTLARYAIFTAGIVLGTVSGLTIASYLACPNVSHRAIARQP